MSDYAITVDTVLEAAGAWGRQADQLRGAAASIDEVRPSAVGSRAAGALTAFRDQWSDRLRSLQQEARGNADALGDVRAWALRVDDDRAAALRGLLPYRPEATP